MVTKYETNREALRINDVITKQDIIRSFKRMGLRKGMVVYVQSNMEKYAHIVGGIQTIIEALQDVLTHEGTIVCSAFSLDLVDPACNRKFLYERDLYDEIRSDLPVFHKKRTKANTAFASQLMMNEGVYRSYHPLHSFLAWGKYAKLVCDKHPLHFSLGKDSPLDKVQELNGYVLLLAEKINHCDFFIYTSTILERTPVEVVTSYIEEKGKKEEIKMLECIQKEEDYSYVEKMMEERHVIIDNYIGNAHCKFFKAKEAITLCKAYFYLIDER